MKSLVLLTCVLTLCVGVSFSQVKQEGVINGKYKTFLLDNGDVKYVKYNKKETTLFIYNLDNSLWKTVKLSLPKNHLLDEVKQISIKTFNKDTLAEIVYSCVVYDYLSDGDGFSVKTSFTLNIINETGDILLKVPGSNSFDIIESKGAKKLLVYKHFGEGFDEQDKTIVYSLPD